MPRSEESHKVFLESLRSSYPAQWQMAYWLWRHKGAVIELQPPREAPRHEDAPKYADSGDIWYRKYRTPEEVAKGGPTPRWMRAEVKAIQADFTCLEDWPHPVMFICREDAYNRGGKRTPGDGQCADLFFILNRARTHFALINCENTHLHWQTRMTSDPRTPEVDPYRVYCMDPALAKFYEYT